MSRAYTLCSSGILFPVPGLPANGGLPADLRKPDRQVRRVQTYSKDLLPSLQLNGRAEAESVRGQVFVTSIAA